VSLAKVEDHLQHVTFRRRPRRRGTSAQRRQAELVSILISELMKLSD